MINMLSTVWISISFILIETNAVIEDPNANAYQSGACNGRESPCASLSMNCPYQRLIQFKSLQYGLYSKLRERCRNGPEHKCPNDSCCTYHFEDCLKDFSQEHIKWLSDLCLGRNSCGSIPVVITTFSEPTNCNGSYSDYITVNYTCVLGMSSTTALAKSSTMQGTQTTMQLNPTENEPSSSGNKSPSTDSKAEDGMSVPAIIGVVIAVIVVIVVVALALILLKRRKKNKSTKGDAHISNLSKGSTNHMTEKSVTNHMTEKSVEVGKSSDVEVTSNYDIISDESVLNYSLPEENMKDNTKAPGTVYKHNNVSADEYDKVGFKMKNANVASNYDHLDAWKGQMGDESYSHVPNQPNYVSTATPTFNNYSLCKPNRKETLTNDDDYSHTFLERDCTVKPESDIREEDYNHIDFENTKHPMQNRTVENGEVISGSETNYTKCTVVKPRDMVEEHQLL